MGVDRLLYDLWVGRGGWGRQKGKRSHWNSVWSNMWGRSMRHRIMKQGCANWEQKGRMWREGGWEWLNLGVRGHWSVWEPEIQIRYLEEEGRGEGGQEVRATQFLYCTTIHENRQETTLCYFMNKSSIWQETAVSYEEADTRPEELVERQARKKQRKCWVREDDQTSVYMRSSSQQL